MGEIIIIKKLEAFDMASSTMKSLDFHFHFYKDSHVRAKLQLPIRGILWLIKKKVHSIQTALLWSITFQTTDKA